MDEALASREVPPVLAATIEVPAMPPASTISTLAFLAIMAGVAAAFVLGVRASTLRLDDDPNRASRHALLATLAVAFYAILTAAIAGSGLLEHEGPVPMLMPFLAASNLLVIGLARPRAARSRTPACRGQPRRGDGWRARSRPDAREEGSTPCG